MTPISYRLHIHVAQDLDIRIGALGRQCIPAGHYCYTGSARRNLEARIQRHLRADKVLRWHIDYLLTQPGVVVMAIERSPLAECIWHQQLIGESPIAGFGASDCRAGCGSHLIRLTCLSDETAA